MHAVFENFQLFELSLLFFEDSPLLFVSSPFFLQPMFAEFSPKNAVSSALFGSYRPLTSSALLCFC
jgi:hypothetical protein